jgi:hypothetical protein
MLIKHFYLIKVYFFVKVHSHPLQQLNLNKAKVDIMVESALTAQIGYIDTATTIR